jgi:hypothetical protein
MSDSTPLTQVVHSPVAALARHRNGAPRGSALVLADGHGGWRLVGPGATARSAGVRFRDVARGRYRSIYQVRLGERFSAFSLNLAAGEAHRIVEAEVQLSWWVSDPVAVAASRISDGEPLVRRAVAGRLQRIAQTHPTSAIAAAEQAAELELQAVAQLSDIGLSYGNGHAVLRLAQPSRAQADDDQLQRDLRAEDARLEMQRRRTVFFGELLRAGHHGLLAYWLANSSAPDDVREVLDRLPTPASAAWPEAWNDLAAAAAAAQEHSALLPAALFAELEEYEREHLREVIVSALLSMGREEFAGALVEQGWPAGARHGAA